MEQYWYKPEKRIKRISEYDNDVDIAKKVAELKANGYVQVLDRKNPESSIVENSKSNDKPKIEAKPKKNTKSSKKSKSKKK
tara:strand:+ start:947 stop:1189 length:243 start_codon:yes stop_codon:yes gene_type:complete